MAFIYYYTKLHGVPPAEADMQRYFKVSPPSVHNMVVTLEKRQLIKRTPGASRSIQLLLGRDQLLDLE
jgi:Mn-dependent DtxR family transcriptional regulator